MCVLAVASEVVVVPVVTREIFRVLMVVVQQVATNFVWMGVGDMVV